MTEGISNSMQNHLVDAVERSDVCHSPFDHIYMEDVLPPANYEALISNLPDRRFYHELRHIDAMRSDGHSTRFRL